MVPNPLDYTDWLMKERRRDLLREADNERLLAISTKGASVHYKVLVILGKMLSDCGDALQRRYGQMLAKSLTNDQQQHNAHHW
jgi:hypothetical protein